MKSDKEVFPPEDPRVNFQALLMFFVVIIKRFQHNRFSLTLGECYQNVFKLLYFSLYV